MTMRILVFCEGIWLAHTARPLCIAAALREAGWQVHFGAYGRFTGLIEKQDFPVSRVATMDPRHALEMIRCARIGYDRSNVELYVEDELTLIRRTVPDVILNDFRLPVAISARVAGVPFANILNAYWTNFYAPRLRAPENFLLTRILGKRIATAVLPPVQRAMLRLYARPFNAAARARGLSPFGNLFDVMASPHLNLICDLEEFMPLEGQPEHFRYIGPVLWQPPVGAPGWLERLDPSRPIVYFSMGSTGLVQYFEVLRRAFGGTDFQVMVATGGVEAGEMPDNFFVTDMAPGLELAAKSDLVICHGGNGTIYQALYHGVPVLGIPTFHDQDFNMQRVEDLGLGEALYPTRLEAASLCAAAERLIEDEGVKARCRAISTAVRGSDAAGAAVRLIGEMAGSAAGQST